jgi:hypothetical protein
MLGADPVLSDYLDQRDRGLYPRASAAAALAEIGKAHQEARDACVAALAAALRHFTIQDRTLNGFLVGHLLDLNAMEASPLMEQAFAEARVDISVAGDWEDAQLALGLIDQRRTPQPNYMEEEGLFVSGAPTAPQQPRDRQAEQRPANKRRRKLAKASKRRNRGK